MGLASPYMMPAKANMGLAHGPGTWGRARARTFSMGRSWHQEYKRRHGNKSWTQSIIAESLPNSLRYSKQYVNTVEDVKNSHLHVHAPLKNYDFS